MSSVFTNPWMLVALLAVSLPIIIEWLFRRRRRRVELPTIRWLLKSKQQEIIKRQNRILLALRMLGVFLLVLALTRPLIQHGLGATRKRHIVILLDGTASTHQQVGTTTAFGLAQKKAAGMIRELPDGTAVTVALLGDRVDRVCEAETDRHTAAARVEALRPRLGAAPISDGLAFVRDVLGQVETDEPELYVFSDFQKYTWQRQGAKTAAVARLLDDLTARSETFLVDVGGDPRFNYVVTAFRPEDWVMSTGLPVRFRALVAARGTLPPEPRATVTFLVDGVKKASREIRPADRPVPLSFEHRFTKPGEYVAEIVLEGDGHPPDNRRFYLGTVAEDVRVLVLDESVAFSGRVEPAAAAGKIGDATPWSPSPAFHASDFLRFAIAPPTHPGTDRVSRFGATVIHPARLDYENLQDYAAVVLTDTDFVDETLAANLTNYVADGGALWVFVGPRTNLYRCNKYLFKDGQGVLPARLVSKVLAHGGGVAQAPSPAVLRQPGTAAPRSPASQPGRGVLHLRFGDSAHPALAELTDAAAEDAKVLGYVELEPAPDARTLVTLSNGLPAFVEKGVGRGKVLLSNSTAGIDWTYLPVTRQFPILVQGLLRYLVGNPDDGVNLQVGDRFEQPVFVSIQHLLLKYPSGRRERVTPRERTDRDDGWMMAVSQTDEQGVYEFVDVMPEVLPRRRFVVNETGEEGDLSRLAEADVRDAFGRASWRWIGPEVPIEGVVARLRALTELAPAILWALVVVLAVESVLALRFGRRRRRMAS